MRKNRLIFWFIGICFFIFNNAFSQDKYLLVIDIQKEFYETTEIKSQANDMVQNINQIISKIEPQKVFYIKATRKMLSVSLRGFSVTPMLPAPDLDSSLKIINNNIFTKVEGDAFTIEKINEILISNDAKEIIIVGLLAEKCIYDTAIGGKEKGYDIYIVPEAIIGGSKEKKEKILKKMIKRGIKILPIIDIVNAS